MRALILGVTGFAGRYLAAELDRLGHEVWGASRSPGADRAAHPVPLATRRLLRCDVTSADEVRDALAVSAADAVVLLSGVSSPPQANRSPDAAFRVHALGAVNVLAVAAARRVRVLVVTSSEVYGASGREASPLREDAPLRPLSVYAASKASADLAAGAFAVAHGCDVVRVRPFNHTGPGQRPDFVCPDFAAQVAEIAAGRRPPVMEVGNVDVRRDFSDVRDVARGYAAALLRGRSGEVYNLCSGRPTRVGDVLAELCALAGVAPEVRPAPARQRPTEVPAYWGCGARAEAELGWRPEIPWRQTLEDLLAWSRSG